MTRQEELKDLWLSAPAGNNLSALEELKAWALREVWEQDGRSLYGMHTFIAGKIRKANGERPKRSAVKKLLDKIAADEEWFPGKQYGGQRGRKRVLTGAKAHSLCRSAKAVKRSVGIVTYPLLCASAPKAVANPETGAPVSKHAVYQCIKEGCYDKDPEKKWGNRRRLCRTALTAAMVARRMAWSVYMIGLPHTSEWYFQNLVWVDICSSILPRTAAKAAELALARKGHRVWCSEDALGDDDNLRADTRVLKTNSWDTRRIWWGPVLSRGKLHIDLLPANFPGDHLDGAAAFVKQVRIGLGKRFPGASRPNMLFTDRGAGFYNPGSGIITAEYRAALAAEGLVAFMGDSAAAQPGKLSDLLLHETAIAWVREQERATLPKRPWEETTAQFSQRLKRIVANVNRNFDVAGLCRELPARVDELHRRNGHKLKK